MKVEEAKKKHCPYPDQIGGCICIANECMSWRWHHEDTFIGETVGGGKLFTNGERIMSKTDGYCGLAGKEGAV